MTDRSAVSIVSRADGEQIALGPITLRFLEDGSTTSHRLAIAEITIPPGVSGPPPHLHRQHDEGFYVVSGTVRFTVGALEQDVAAGTLVMVPPGTPHTFANPAGQTAVMINTFTPDLYVQYFRDVQEYFASGEPVDPQTLTGIMRRYATEPVTDVARTNPQGDPR
jgi:mannose-6-phosphate isomerase-like protein (cupin superfamily)